MRKLVYFLSLSMCLCAGDLKWSDPISLSSSGASNPQTVMDAEGNAVFLWIENGILKANSYRNGLWGTAVTLANGSDPRVAMDGDGNAVAVWLEDGVVKTASLPVGGVWSDAVALSDVGASAPEIAVDGKGNAIAVWIQQFVKASTKLVGGDWPSTPDLLYPTTTADSPQVSIGVDGTAIAVWHDVNPDAVYGVTKALGGEWGERVLLSNVGYPTMKPSIAVGPGGNAIATWFRIWNQNNIAPQAAEFIKGVWNPAVDLNAFEGTNSLTDLWMKTAYDAQGNAMVLWSYLDSASLVSIFEVAKINGNWTLPVTLQAKDPSAVAVDLKVAPAGTAAVGYMTGVASDVFAVKTMTTDMESSRFNFWSYPETVSTVAMPAASPRMSLNNNSQNVLCGSLTWIGSDQVIQAAISK